MRLLISIFKNSLRTIFAIVALVFVCLYIAAHYNLNGYIAKKVLSEDLANYLGTEVKVGNAEVDIFNQIVLEQLLVKDLQSDTLLSVRRAMVSFDLLPLLQKRLEIHSIQLIDFDIKLSRQDSLSDPNFQFLVEVFAPKNDKENTLDAISVNSIILRSGSVSYDNYSKPRQGKYLDINHLRLCNISSNLRVRTSKKDGLSVRIKRLAFDEQSGISVDKSSAQVMLDAGHKYLALNDIMVSCSQTLDSRLTLTAEAEGSVRYENQQLNAVLTSLAVDAPSMLNASVEASATDVMSKHQPMTFNAKVNSLTVTNSGIAEIIERYFGAYKEKTAAQIARVDRLMLSAEADGSIDYFTYSVSANTVGKTTLEALAEGAYTKEIPVDCEITADIANLEFKNHEYETIALSGNLTSGGFEGSVMIDDALCSIAADGNVEMADGSKSLNMNAEIKHISPYALNLTTAKNLEKVSFSAKVKTEAQLANLYNPVGIFNVDSLVLCDGTDSLHISNICLTATKDEGRYVAKAESPLFDITYDKDDSAAIVHGVIHDEQRLSGFLKLPVTLIKQSDFYVELDSKAKHIRQATIKMPEAIINGKTVSAAIRTKGEADSLKHNLSINLTTSKYQVASVLDITTKNNPLFIEIHPCDVVVNGDVLNCDGVTLQQVNAKTYQLGKFSMSHKEQHISAEGIVSLTGRNDLAIRIENLGLDTLFSYLDNQYLSFGGVGTGDIHYSSDSIDHVKAKNLFIKDFSYMHGVIGDTNLDAFYDLKQGRIDLDADVLCGEDHHSHIDGYIKRGKIDSLDLNINADKMRVDFLDYWLKGFLQDFKGNLTGEVHLFGPARRLNLIGNPYVDVSFTNKLVGAPFFVHDNILLTTEGSLDNGLMSLRDVKVYDKFGQAGSVDASIRHQHLVRYNYDVEINLPESSNGFLLFDKPTHFNNELYWGQLFASGTILLRGGNGKHRVDVSCKTEGKSQFNISPGEESYSDNGYNFLTFRDKQRFEESEKLDYSDSYYVFGKDNEVSDNSTHIECSIQAQASENCQVYVQMDPLAEDRLICRGNGNISLHYDPRHDITIGGEYNITSGNYLITMRGDLMSKEFKIQNGSRVTFPGNFSNADLDINAVYSIPSVNLRDLDESFATTTSMNRTTLPVDCKLAVTGQLSAPQIGFDIEVKNTSDDVQALVHNLIGTQEMLNREVLYLLLFNKFYTPEYATASQNNAGAQLSSFASSSLTSQLNNLLGHVSDNFTLGTNFRSDKGDFSDMEMDLSLSTRLLGDRLILNGNLGYRDPANRVGLHNNTNSFIGDFDVEFLINTSGTLRAKAYSHYNERDYSINNALTTQGIGFIVRKDFKSAKELLFWKRILEKK